MLAITNYKKTLTIGIAFNFVRMLVGGFSTLYLTTQGLSYSDIGLLKSFQALIILFSDVPLGYISDKISRKYTIILAIFFASMYLFITGIANSVVVNSFTSSLSMFYLAEFCNAISLALFNGSFIAFLVEEYKTTQKAPKHIISLYHSNSFLFMAVASALGGTFFKLESNTVWLLAGLMCFLLSIIAIITLPNKVKYTKKSHSSFLATLVNTIKKDIKIYATLFKRNKIILFYVIILYLSISFAYQCIIQYWQILFKVSTNFMGTLTLAVSYTFVAILLLQSFASRISKNLNFVAVMIFCSVFLLLNNIVFLYALHIKNNILSISIIGLMFFLLRLITTSLEGFFHGLLYNRIRATFDSSVSTLNRVLLIIFLPVLGVLMVKFNEKVIIYGFILVCIISITFSIIIALRYRKTKNN